MVEERLVVLLLKVAVAASVASVLVRFSAFKRTLLREERAPGEQFRLALALAIVFGAGVAVRVITRGYSAADLGLEGAFIAGVVGGYFPGLVTGVLVSIPAMFNHELLSMPLFAAVGVLGGLIRDAAPEPEEVYSLSPFFDLAVYRLFRNWSDHRRAMFQVFFLMSIMLVEFLRFCGHTIFNRNETMLFTVYPAKESTEWLALAAIWISTTFAILLPIKIWDNACAEQKLEMQERLLQQARLRALAAQINPHFLFNTLNSIGALVRTDPDSARVVIHRLSNILRRLMRRQDHLSTLKEELAFIDDYLSIEIVRFGDKLRFKKEIAPETLDEHVPSMLLQPVIENCLKHGLSPKVEGGTICLRSWIEAGRLNLVVEDDGVGIPEANLAKLFEQGIGISNVNERLKVLFGADYKMWVDSKPGEGTRTGFEIPSAAHEPARAVNAASTMAKASS
ncbi:MAG: histidine kinase [Bryobacteraceae bacterium]